MRVAVVSDIHANWHALEAVVADFDGVDEVICLGDVVGYGGEPVQCLDHVREQGWLSLVGNHDRACTDAQILAWFNDDAATAIRWTMSQLESDRLGWLEERPERALRDQVVLVHASPRDPIYEYILDIRTAATNLAEIGAALCFHGHSHVPGIFYPDGDGVSHDYGPGVLQLQGPSLINPGSVGQPRDGSPDSSYGLWDTEAVTFEFRRVAYDREAAKASILKAGLPVRFASRLDVGR